MEKIKSFFFNLLQEILIISNKFGIDKKTPGALRVYNFLYRFFWPYERIIDIQGSKMYLNINDEPFKMRQTFQAYASNLIHEKATTSLFKKNIKERDTVIDLGSNIGYFTLLAAKLVGPEGKVFAFEPEPNNFKYLNKNININNYRQVEAFQKAVSDKNGKTKLYICDYDTGHHTINQYNGIESYSRGRFTEEKAIEITTVTLDSFLEEKTTRVDIIKMDVEGAEALALAGMDNILRRSKKLKMFIEFFPLLIEKMGNSPEEFIRKLLDDYKFSIYVIPDDYDALSKEMKRLNNIDDAMSYRKREEDHINLFLIREQQ